MTPIKFTHAPLTKRISALAITAAAAFSFAILSPEAQANHVSTVKPTNEYKALDVSLKQLFPNATVETATPDQLRQAVAQAITAAPKYKPGNIAGEALKHSGDENAGDEIAQALLSAVPGDTVAVADAIKRAGKGKDVNVRLVPGFVAEFLPNAGDNSAALALAKLVKSTKPGTGAVIGGRALDLAGAPLAQQAQIEQLVNEALAKTAGLSGAAQDIAKYAAAVLAGDLGDTAEFALDIASANIPLAQKVVVGAVAGDPLNGGPIIDKVLDQDTTGALSKLKTGILPLVKGAAAVADIEEISHIAVAVGKQIAKPSGTKTAILFSKAASVVKTLAGAIVAKSTTANPLNSVENKQDEIAEVAAFMVGHILNAATVNGVSPGKPQVTAKNAGAKIFTLVLNAVNVAKSAKVQGANPGLYPDLTVDVAASVAETLGALRDFFSNDVIPDEFFDGIKNFLFAKAKVIAGKAGTQAAIETAINAAYASGIDGRFEIGVPSNAGEATNRDETDFRPF